MSPTLVHHTIERRRKLSGLLTSIGEKLSNPRTFVSMEMDGKTGSADGLRCDEEGDVWVAAGWVGDGYDGVHVFKRRTASGSARSAFLRSAPTSASEARSATGSS